MALQPAMFPELEGGDFLRSEEVADVASDVLRIHGRAGTKDAVLRLVAVAQAIADGEVHVLWLVNAKPFDELTERLEHDTAGKCIKAPKLWHDVTGFDVAIWVREYWWNRWDEADRRAVILHELLHVDVEHDKNDRVRVSTRKHDVEGFVDVARLYGPIEGDGAAYVRAATLSVAKPLQDLADESGTTITVKHGDRTATLTPHKPADTES